MSKLFTNRQLREYAEDGDSALVRNLADLALSQRAAFGRNEDPTPTGLLERQIRDLTTENRRLRTALAEARSR